MTVTPNAEALQELCDVLIAIRNLCLSPNWDDGRRYRILELAERGLVLLSGKAT